MDSQDAIEQKSLADVAADCSEESRRYRQGIRGPSPGCLELFRRAILEGCQPAWHYLVKQYEALIRHWIGWHHESTDELIQDTWLAFIHAVTPERWTRGEFSTLGSVMAYLRMVAISQAIKDKRRGERQAAAINGLEQKFTSSPASVPLSQLSRQELVEAIYARLVDDQEQRLVRLMFEYGLKPAEIVKEYPEDFVDAKAVYRIRNRVIKRLQRDPVLRKWMD